ncbi:MAG TPA: hypothetical protein VGR78_19640, partial [Verrucomicrobiae bacterium]|nr:hypothetical protein [Verrucomicrobiae bacterium]
MQPLDFTKAKILLFLYCIFAPILGVLIRNSRWGQRLVFLAFCFCAVSGFLQAQEWGLTIHPILYRGTARGFHFYWAEVAAVALIVAQMAGNWRNFRFFPPGFWLYALYCAASCISIMNAPKPLYGYLAAFKAIKIIIAFVAAYNFVRSEEDLRFALVSLAFVILWELIAVL